MKVDRLLEKQDGILDRIEKFNSAKVTSDFKVEKEIFGVESGRSGNGSDCEELVSPLKSPSENITPISLKKGKLQNLKDVTPLDLNADNSAEEDEEEDDVISTVEDVTPAVDVGKKRKATIVADKDSSRKRVSTRSRPVRKTR